MGDLPPGPHAVGFTTSFAYDHARVYGSPSQSRPILVNVWYPAAPQPNAQALCLGQYLELENDGDLALEGFAQRLAAFQRGGVCEEIMGKAPEELGEDERGEFDRFLQTPTVAFRDAPPAAGRFPLVLYHAGFGGVVVDDTALFELLASHGYVVVNSAYQPEDAAAMAIDCDFERSLRDLTFLRGHIQDHPQVDATRVGVMGYSYGAQSALAWATVADPPIGALVSLDATLEYVPLDQEEVRVGNRVTVNVSLREVRTRFEGAPRLSVPLLIFTQARMRPDFALYERLPHAERYYAQVKFLNHLHFVSQGVAASERRPEAIEGEGVGNPAQIARAYELVCLSTLHFLDAHLKGDATAQALLRDEGLPRDDEMPLAGMADAVIHWGHEEAVPLSPADVD